MTVTLTVQAKVAVTTTGDDNHANDADADGDATGPDLDPDLILDADMAAYSPKFFECSVANAALRKAWVHSEFRI